MFLRQINDPGLAQYAYFIGCPRTGEALIIDPERDIDRYRVLAEVNDLRITAVAETHIHADFVSGAQEFAADPSVTLYLSGEGGEDWSYKWPRGRDKAILLRHREGFRCGEHRCDCNPHAWSYSRTFELSHHGQWRGCSHGAGYR